MLGLLTLAEVLGMSVWFSAGAVAPQLRELWSLSAQQIGWLTGAVQLGFVAGTALATVLNLADVLPSRVYFASSAMLAALANGALIVASGFSVALALRFVTGFALAGVYPPAMKMISTWFRSRRGLAVGTVVGGLTVGKALPYLSALEPGRFSPARRPDSRSMNARLGNTLGFTFTSSPRRFEQGASQELWRFA
jgi:MFS family permease